MSKASPIDDILADPFANVAGREPGAPVDASPAPGHLAGYSVSAGTGGTCQVKGDGGAGRGLGEPDHDDEWRQLNLQMQRCSDQLTADLQEYLGIPAADAAEQVSRGVRMLLRRQLDRIAVQRRGRQRREMVRGFHTLLRDVKSLEAQLRCYARYAFRRLHKEWSEQRRKEYAETAPLDELLKKLGYNQSVVQRYYEHRRIEREHFGRRVLKRLGFQDVDAGRYLHRLREKRGPEEFPDLLDELEEIERSPSQHPAHARAGASAPQVDAETLGGQIDALLSLRAAARAALQDAGWSDANIASRLRNCSRGDLEAMSLLPGPPQPLPSAPPAGQSDSGAQDGQEPGREGVPDATNTYR